MRTGGCTVQQALTPEAAAVVKQAVSLALRRGHAQVTPLHVASSMLSASSGILRAACLQSHSHPLQCKALELCFNVALNRLPASSSSCSSSSILAASPHFHQSHHHPPSLSNALVAAFKRAQAHQRRGSIESQQQPLLAVKVELEQLVISILDDPSVSRVMREAGFSSTQVKSSIEQAISLATKTSNFSKPRDIIATTTTTITTTTTSNSSCTSSKPRAEDVTGLVECLLSKKKKNLVVVGECLAASEGVVRGLMNRVERGEVPELLSNLQLITLPLFSIEGMSRGEVEKKVGELQGLIKSCCMHGRGAVLYLEDLRWTADFRSANSSGFGDGLGSGFYCPVEHAMMEIRRIVCSTEGGRFWLMAIATYQTYMKCRIGNPSLEVLWGLQPLTVPVGSLELSLKCDRESSSTETQSLFKSERGATWTMLRVQDGNQLTCCTNCSIKFENVDAPSLKDTAPSMSHGSAASILPPWLQQYKADQNMSPMNDQDYLQLSVNCNPASAKQKNQTSEMNLCFSSTSSPSSSLSFYNNCHTSFGQRVNHSWASHRIIEGLPFPGSITNPNLNLTSTSDILCMEYHCRFNEVNAENLKILCNALEEKVPWQRAIIPDIASTILQCRAGIIRKRDHCKLVSRNKKETWLFFRGGDFEGKERIARELANLVFGSHTNFVKFGLSNFSPSRVFPEKLAKAMKENPHGVFLVEDIEQLDSYSKVIIKSAVERGRIRVTNGEEVAIGDAIVILSCESFDSRSKECSPSPKQKMESSGNTAEAEEKEKESCILLDLNLSAADEADEECSSIEDDELLEVVDRAFFLNYQMICNSSYK
ncbi:Chaperone protein ClpB1 [Apostasia shenzhenica]|uniref:Chaperone protein ClpB1 n=1 Tax=Apostasia shenzhenica TaxID=1088818 RepID=A0A2I0ALI1_9ASPA|nr:Chaperone protein ClpB1 [Apostasia shenzhenica]